MQPPNPSPRCQPGNVEGLAGVYPLMRTPKGLLLLSLGVLLGCQTPEQTLKPSPPLGEHAPSGPLHPGPLHPGPEGVQLLLSRSRRGARTNSLQVTVMNRNARTLAIVTGIRIGTGDYPEAGFHFQLNEAGHPPVNLYCSWCAPSLIAGDVGLYVISLEPSKSKTFIVPWDFLSWLDGPTERHLDPVTLHGASITVVLHGEELPKEPGAWLGEATGTLQL